MAKVRERMVDAMRELYGVESPSTRTRIAKSDETEASEPEDNERTG